MSANPIDEAMQALADELWLASGRVRTLAKTIAAAQQQGQAVAWVRYRSDGGIEGPVLDQHMDDIRRNSGAWTPLGRITAPPPSAPVGVAEALRDARHAGSLLANIAYNLAQDESLSEPVRRSLDDARKRWDLTTKDSRAALGPARGPHRRQGGRT